MAVIGTAGHVDHGKSSLVLALTGRDPDRWAEEKRRGLTIDLGFAWATLPGGVEVSFVDVPGHERFMKNMLAGIESIDVALLVVAADEGWMPQSEEHLNVLDLLGVRTGVVAISKIDRVDSEIAELAALEVEEHLAGSSLAGSPLIHVSARTGEGVDDLARALAGKANTTGFGIAGRPRMWIDRSFSVAGAGTVVTGTLLGGSVAVGDRVAVWPEGLEARIRSLQSHERDLDVAEPARRVAVGLAGIDRGDIRRGSMLGAPEGWLPSRRLLATLRTARYVDELTDRGAYHVHIGSGGWPTRIRLHDGYARIDLPEPLCVQTGDRFIIRDTGRRLVVGGGRVLAPEPPRRFDDAAIADLVSALDGGADARAAALLRLHGRARPALLAAHSGGGQAPAGSVYAGTAMTPEEAASLTERIRSEVADFHRRHPLRPGQPLAELAGTLGIPQEVATALASTAPGLALEGGLVRDEAFATGRTPEQEEMWKEARRRLEVAAIGDVPRPDDLGLSTELIHALVRDGELVRISPDLVYLPGQIADLVGVMRSFDHPFTVSEYKELAGISRKYAVPVLEWADDTGLTVRMGDRRRLRRRE